MRSFDPDEQTPYVEPDEGDGIQLDDDVVSIDVERALALLDGITHDLPGGGEVREGQRANGALRRRAPSPGAEHAIIEAGTGVGKSLAYLGPAAMSGPPGRHRDRHEEPPGPTRPEGRPDRRCARVEGERSRC